jgi:hypothetical protein
MHHLLVEQLIAEEVERVRGNDLLRDRVQLEQEGTRVLVHARRPDRAVLLALDGPNYDAEPYALMALDPESREPLAGPAWPPGLAFGSDHPVLARPWACLRGTYEYYRHTSHVAESWDQDRYRRDLPTLLGHLLARAGCQ